MHPADSHSLRRPLSTYKISGPLHLSQSEIDKDGKDSEDGIGLDDLPTNSIGVKTETEVRSEPLNLEYLKARHSEDYFGLAV